MDKSFRLVTHYDELLKFDLKEGKTVERIEPKELPIELVSIRDDILLLILNMII